MKAVAYLCISTMAFFMMACGGSKSNNPVPSGTGVADTTTHVTPKILKNILVNNIIIAYSNGVTSTIEFTNNAGTDILLTAATGGVQVSLNNQGMGTRIVSNITAHSYQVSYTNIVKTNDDRVNTDTIATKYSQSYVYVKIPVSKSVFGYDEIHAYLNNDGGTNAGQISINGDTNTNTDTQTIFEQSKMNITTSVIE